MVEYISKTPTPRVSIAPMVDKTDKHFRHFSRLMTTKALLYTEMITCQAILNGDRKKLLDFDDVEKPLALQIAGSNPKEVYEAIKLAEAWDYDEINLNVGCPSDRVSGNCMGAALMAYPELVRDMVSEMRRATSKPITVKHRIGIDGKNILPDTFKRTLLDRYEDMVGFVTTVEKAQVDRFIIHARIAILEGLSPKENREIPPIRYEEVYRLKEEFPHLQIEINGGVKNLDGVKQHLSHVDSVMIGRAAYENPYFLRELDSLFTGSINNISRKEVLERYIPYVEGLEKQGENAFYALKHTLDLFSGKPGSRLFKQLISTPPSSGIKPSQLLRKALSELSSEVLQQR